MNIHSSEFHPQEPGQSSAATPDEGHTPAPIRDSEFLDSAARQWEALHGAAGAVGSLAHLPPEQTRCDAADFAALLAGAPRWKAQLANTSLEDIGAFMQSGLAALLAVHAENRDPSAAALALWSEFAQARDAVLELLPER
ncbi:hypothetical protein [Allopontixanthobacter sp.]|uniref:hypothetical protein n=1 Tax=Allopontixanthobacter sp. TaxID=2906452 RepID=UPI002ABC13BA|nr:hypothetical protein [Allopontixanthobacter sp.]MDZ4308640.1 hypothetical protein [Allopontixanthobacter sp.]